MEHCKREFTALPLRTFWPGPPSVREALCYLLNIGINARKTASMACRSGSAGHTWP